MTPIIPAIFTNSSFALVFPSSRMAEYPPSSPSRPVHLFTRSQSNTFHFSLHVSFSLLIGIFTVSWCICPQHLCVFFYSAHYMPETFQSFLRDLLCVRCCALCHSFPADLTFVFKNFTFTTHIVLCNCNCISIPVTPIIYDYHNVLYITSIIPST